MYFSLRPTPWIFPKVIGEHKQYTLDQQQGGHFKPETVFSNSNDKSELCIKICTKINTTTLLLSIDYIRDFQIMTMSQIWLVKPFHLALQSTISIILNDIFMKNSLIW